MNKQKIVGYWLILGVVMLMIQVLLGGITRLTGSGLSITEWKPLLGALPPMSEAEWQLLFSKYQTIAQYKYLNQDFTISNFKFIFFWEWFHRNWARFISIAFIIPFIYFIYKEMITKEMIPKLIGLFCLGLAQGLIGWIMVASGLNDENLYVSHIRLAVHFVSALVLIGFTFWFALSLIIPDSERVNNPSLKNYSIGLMVLLGVQLVYGAFMAGLKAASIAPTWPDINGAFIPSGMSANSFINHPINIHFVHRMIAYVLLILFLIWFMKAFKLKSSNVFTRFRWVPIILVLFQVILGILSVLNATHVTRNGLGIFEYFALFHQIIAMCLTMSMIWVLYILSRETTN